MNTSYIAGTRIAFTASRESGKRVECVGEFTGVVANDCPEVCVILPTDVFIDPPTFQAIPPLIEEGPAGLRYRGEMGGAVLFPDFVWA
jgi:hypothetical protein